jgi:type IV pilus assembly protein PilP
MMRSLRGLLLLPILSLLLTACGDDSRTELKTWMDGVKKDTKVRVPPLTEPKVFVPVAYEGAGMTDPFNPAKLLVALARMKANADNGLRPNFDRPREALEAYPLDQMQMRGFTQKNKQITALILVGKSMYQVRLGNYVGQNFGKVIGITETQVEIEEIVQDAAGEWTKRKATLELQEGKK